ncbi:unnamed protein product [Kuraishia capsulata CBS 1993]|uniref:Transcription factor Pcc1 n=1 Tax=Kuraishia capsulata CBS 1993 TaxID=1382522 RepID=W6MGF1_9ASCO|nr:uncharacterized protein KUCA_T00001131001 [Kuraishia capsulata CBS 1993]CDK25164.1 unnamed protein product [Kuraishia capsulata CBS 1993]
MSDFNHTLAFSVPFETARQAQIAQRALDPDPILKPSELSVEYSTEDTFLKIDFKGRSDRVIRVAANNVLENLKTVVECMDEFEGQKDVCI